MLKLIGVLIVIVGFALRFNAIAIVMSAGFVTAMVSGMSIPEFLSLLGETFVNTRYMAMFIMIIPVIGVLERNGMKQTAAMAIGKIKNASPGKVVSAYGIFRTIFAAFNVSFGGVAGFVRPVVYPMAVGTIEETGHEIEEEDEEEIKAMCGAIENVAWFFGQVLFVAGAGILLVKGTLEPQGYEIDPMTCVKAEVPVVIFALVVTTILFMLKDRKMMKKYTQKKSSSENKVS
ncbi:DUF969 domain-containing protein [Acidaminobacter sp. JC074]|uniref:DUF969 domain-containing protein n=1 Tax=Acidaminobacter sp. JC074 TaxID=2530199 RepID=UPI001F10AC43|nr:DUF969 domain-containing protein [Acidaminobacter sp. JC074]MCH4886954.1 DUF969 domain-containing protein [Acidaminobacter sp. JC074]